MCHRISPLLIEELRAALGELHESGHARVPRRDPAIAVPDVYPGKQLPLFVTDEGGAWTATELIWGFQAPSGGRLVFNTRLDTALSHARSGRGMWAEAIMRGRCVVPVHGFYEHGTVDRTRRGGQWRFTFPSRPIFLLAGIWQDDRCSIVTTSPNADVSPIHSRMPLVLAPGESSAWLAGDFERLADRSQIRLDAQQEA